MAQLSRRNEPAPKRQGRNNRELYQSHRWHKYSTQYRKINRLCVMCLREGVTQVSQCVDHIVPIKEGGSIWDSDNHQALCTKHHNQKTALENKNQKAKINVVYGPPCSGKSTLIRSQMQFGDYVLDIDSIAKSILGTSTKDHRIRTRDQILILLTVRDSIVRALSGKDITIWMPTTTLNGFLWESINYNLIQKKVTKDMCIDYLNNSDRTNKDSQLSAINEWFEKQSQNGNTDPIGGIGSWEMVTR